MYLLAIAWLYVVVLMAVAEGAADDGSWLGAAITLAALRVLPLGIALYLFGTPARRAARRRAAASAARSIQTAAAIRPVMPSRRYEKNRDGVADRAPGATATARRRRREPVAREPGQVGQPLPGACDEARRADADRRVDAERERHVDADLERGGARCRRRARHRSSRGAQAAAAQTAATVASTTPAARPRQPAWAAPTARPPGAASSTGRQSAAWTTQAMPGSVVTQRVGLVHGAPRRHRRGRHGPLARRGPGAGTPAPRRMRLGHAAPVRGDVPPRRRRPRRRRSSTNGAGAHAAGARGHQAPTPRDAPVGPSQSATAALRSRRDRPKAGWR